MRLSTGQRGLLAMLFNRAEGLPLASLRAGSRRGLPGQIDSLERHGLAFLADGVVRLTPAGVEAAREVMRDVAATRLLARGVPVKR